MYRDTPKAYLLLLPALLLMVILFGAGLAGGIGQSFLSPKNGCTLDAYRALFEKTYLIQSLFLSLKIAVTATIFSVLLGLSALFLLYSI